MAILVVGGLILLAAVLFYPALIAFPAVASVVLAVRTGRERLNARRQGTTS